MTTSLDRAMSAMRHTIDRHGAIGGLVVTESHFGHRMSHYRLRHVPQAAEVALTLGGWCRVADERRGDAWVYNDGECLYCGAESNVGVCPCWTP